MIGFSEANAKIKRLKTVPSLVKYLDGRKVYSFDILSGWSCPFADECMSKVYIINGKKKVVDGPNTQFRCFSASQEALFPHVYNKRKENFEAVKYAVKKGVFEAADLLDSLLPDDAGIVRIHVGGDFFSENYMLAWFWLAVRRPNTLFYAYTKSLNFWIKNRKKVPQNLVLTASRGGRLDNLIKKHKLREAIVVFSKKEAKNLNLEIDKDDSHAADPSKKKQSFALLIHGTQPAKSEAGKAVRELKGEGSYS